MQVKCCGGSNEKKVKCVIPTLQIKMNGSIMEVTDNLLQQLLLNTGNQYSLAMKSPWERAQ